MARPRGGTGIGGALFTALTGLRADVTGSTSGDVRSMLLAIGGSSSRTRSGIDLTRAATELGVSRRTVERWVRTATTGTGQRPSPVHLKQIARKARQSVSTQKGRRAALARSSRPAAMAARGARVALTGMQGPRAAGLEYLRDRTTQLELDPEAAQAMLDAWQNGGEKGFTTWASQHWGQEYVPDWSFGDLSEVSIERPYGERWR